MLDFLYSGAWWIEVAIIGTVAFIGGVSGSLLTVCPTSSRIQKKQLELERKALSNEVSNIKSNLKPVVAECERLRNDLESANIKINMLQR